MSNNLPTEKQIQEIIDQAPSWTTSVQVSELWVHHQGDIVAILASLWECETPAKKVATKWDAIRDICDAHDAELERVMKSHKQ
jgi:uncharacterized protein CbrC (UPF0167 family)